MITKEKFISSIYHIQNFNNTVDKLCDMGVDILNSDLCNDFDKMQEILFSSNFTEEGCDWINWWLYERKGYGDIINEAYDSDGNLIKLDTLEELWNLVNNYLKK